jgi:hypothetical protein
MSDAIVQEPARRRKWSLWHELGFQFLAECLGTVLSLWI